MIGGGGSFKNIAVMLTANNSNLRSTLIQSAAGVDAFTKKVESSNGSLVKSSTLLKSGLAAGALAAGAGLAYAVTQAVEFDKNMRNVNSLAGLGEKAFGQLEQRVISLSTKLPQSASVLAEGLYDIYSSGFQGADGMKVLESAALSASAGLTTTEVAAKAISATLNAYGRNASDAADVSDVLFQTVNAGVITFDELAGNLGDVVGGAAAAKVGIDQVGSAIAAMTLAGIGGAESTTSLNALLQKIVQPSKALAAQFADLGYESGAQALEVDGLRGVMEKLRVATGGNITTLLQLFPEIRAARGALALMANEGKNYASTAAQIEDKAGRAGAAQRVFNEQMKAAANQAQLLKNQVDAVAIGIGTQLLPALLQIMDGTRDFGEALGDVLSILQSEFSPGLSDLGKVLADLWTILGVVAGALWSVGEPLAELGVGVVAESFNALLSVLEPVTDALAGNEAAVLALAAAWALFSIGGMARVVSSIGPALISVFLGMLNGIGALEGGLVAARAAMVGFIASTGPLIAVAALVYAGVTAWQEHTRAVKETKAALSDLEELQSKGTVTALREQVTETQNLLKERQKLVDEYDVDSFDPGKFLNNSFNPTRWDNVFALGDYKDSIGTLTDGSAEGQKSLMALSEATVQLASEFDMLTPEHAKELMDALADGGPGALAAADELDSIIGDLGPKMEAAGINATELSDALHEVKIGDDGTLDTTSLEHLGSILSTVRDASNSTKDAQEDVADAFIKAGNEATTAGDAAKELKEALDGLTSASMDVDAAGINWRKGLTDLKKTLIDTEGGIKGNSDAAGEQRLAIQGSISDMKELLVAQANNGAGTDKLTDTLFRSRRALIETGKAAGIHKEDMRALLKQYRLTPALVKTLIQQSGGKGVKDMLKGINAESDKIPKKKPKLTVTASVKGALKDMGKALDFAVSFNKTKAELKAQAKTDKAVNDLLHLGEVAKDTDGQSVKIPTAAPGASAAEQSLLDVYRAMNNLDGKTATVTTIHRDISKKADGGFSPSGSLPKSATIMPGMGAGLIQWAEGETGGEAFIPLSPAKRGRSTQILKQVASTFGMDLVQTFADGGLTANVGLDAQVGGVSGAPGGGGGAGSSGGGSSQGFPGFSFHYKPFHFRKKGKKETAAAYAKARAKAHREYERDKRDARLEAMANWREEKRLYETSQGRGAGAFVPVAGNAAATMSAYADSREAQAQAAAELKARKSKNPYDTAEDYYKKPIISIKEYLSALDKSKEATKDWGKDLTTVSKGAGADVVAALQGMGEDGQKWIDKLAHGSVKQMQAMADKLREIQFMSFQQSLTQDIAAQQQFAMNLSALIGMGQGDLAAQFAEMGYADAGILAAQAVTMAPEQLAALAAQMATQDALSSTKFTDAVKLAGLLQSASSPLGIVGLSAASGMSISDVIGLLQTFNADVFSKVPKPKIKQIRTDQALLADGKQPSGLANGGIVLGSKATDGQFYQWAEKGSGGESLIPLGAGHRSRALDLWETTGRMIGAGVRAGSGGSSVVIMPGAVVVDIDASGQPITRAELESIAQRTADRAMDGLASKIIAGKK